MKSPKIYVRDTGLYHHLVGIRGMDELLSSPRCGTSWEGFILEGIIRNAGLQVHPAQPFYYRTQRGLEVDLVLQSGANLSAIEVKFGSRLERRWVETLRAAMGDIGAAKGAIVHSGEESYTLEDGVQVLSAKDLRFVDKVLPDRRNFSTLN